MWQHFIVNAFLVVTCLVMMLMAMLPKESYDEIVARSNKRKAIWHEIKVSIEFFKYRLKLRGLI